MNVKHGNSPVICVFCIIWIVSFDGGTVGIPIGPRIPDAASGSSVDSFVYLGRDDGDGHVGEDGASKYLHMGQEPKPASVKGSQIKETRLKLDAADREILPRPADVRISTKRHLLWFGFGGEVDKQSKDDRIERGAEHPAEEEGGEEPHHEDEELKDNEDMDHINNEDDSEDQDEADPVENRANDNPRIFYTYSKIIEVAADLQDEYQQKSLDMKAELRDDEARERVAHELEDDIDTKINYLMKKVTANKQHDNVDHNEDDKKRFIEKLMNTKASAKKRVKDILTGHNIHFDSDDL